MTGRFSENTTHSVFTSSIRFMSSNTSWFKLYFLRKQKHLLFVKERENTVKMMSLSSGVRTPCVFGWISIIWFISTVSIGSTSVELQVKPFVEAKCGDNVMLTCNISEQSLKGREVKKISWTGGNKTLCHYDPDKHKLQHEPGVLCEVSNHTLTLTLNNVTLGHAGQYLCKIQTTMGPHHNPSTVAVNDCWRLNPSTIIQSPTTSSGAVVELKWICLVVEIMMVKFMT